MPITKENAKVKEKSMSKEEVEKVIELTIKQNPLVFKRLAEI
jgi:hypothetical protein